MLQRAIRAAKGIQAKSSFQISRAIERKFDIKRDAKFAALSTAALAL
jgi:hypothetical protein